MNEYLNYAEAGRELGISRQRVFALVKAERIKNKRVGGFPVIARSELNRFKKTRNGTGRSKSKRKSHGF